jgi:ATP-dependent protease ClpP protease subunit
VNFRQHVALGRLFENACYKSYDAPPALRERWRVHRDKLQKMLTPTKVVNPTARPELAEMLPGPIVFPPGKGKDCASFLIHGELVPWVFDGDVIVRQLADAKSVFIGLDNGAGDLSLALKLFDALAGRDVTVEISGSAISAGAVLAMSGQRRRIARGGWFMIHSPIFYTHGCPAQLRAEADRLEKAVSRCVDIFAQATGQPRAAIEALMDGRDHWFDAEAAVASGLATSVYDPPSPPPSEAAS